MNSRGTYQTFRFERQRRLIPPRLIPIGVSLALFTLLWALVPQSVLFWLLLPIVAVLTWVASYGALTAVATLHELLTRIDQR